MILAQTLAKTLENNYFDGKILGKIIKVEKVPPNEPTLDKIGHFWIFSKEDSFTYQKGFIDLVPLWKPTLFIYVASIAMHIVLSPQVMVGP